jgi:putative membrane protein
MILFLVLIGFGIYFLFFNNGKSNIKFPNSKSPEEKLKERFVNGEIDEETYKKMKETLDH